MRHYARRFMNKPQQENDAELITDIRDREFTEDTGFWYCDFGWSIVNNTLTRDNTSRATRVEILDFLSPGEEYLITINLLERSGANIAFSASDYTLGGGIELMLGTHTYRVKPKTKRFTIVGFGATAVIKSISIKEA